VRERDAAGFRQQKRRRPKHFARRRARREPESVELGASELRVALFGELRRVTKIGSSCQAPFARRNGPCGSRESASASARSAAGLSRSDKRAYASAM